MALAQPTKAHPLTILVIGDSIGADLGVGLGDLFGENPAIHLVTDSVGSTGLARPDYYNWPAQLEVELAEYHPGIVVVMLGGNDAQSFDVGTRYVGFGSAAWRTIYAARVATVMREATSAGARVLWAGMPIMSPSSNLSNVDMSQLNAVYQAQAATHPGVTYFSSSSVLESSSGGYAEYLPNAEGTLVQVRDPDGIHIEVPDGTDLLARAAIVAMDKAFSIKL